VQPVQIDTAGGTKLAGQGIGAVAGGLLGNQVGGGKGKTLATVAGALGGAVAGNAVASRRFAQQGLQITVKLDSDAGVVAVTQAADPAIAVGERVEVIGNGWNSLARVEPIGTAPGAK
jgi:outer membrane lipoprotein SlyB